MGTRFNAPRAPGILILTVEEAKIRSWIPPKAQESSFANVKGQIDGEKSLSPLQPRSLYL